MKYRIFTVLVSLAAWCLKVQACSPPDRAPNDVRIFRVLDDELYFANCGDKGVLPSINSYSAWRKKADREANIRLWQQQTSRQISLNDIEDAVYRFSSEQIAYAMANPDDALRSNSFTAWVARNGRNDIAELLLAAKQCEAFAKETADPWYYFWPGDDPQTGMSRLADKCMKAVNGPMAARYALQAMRALVASMRYEECLNLWEKVKGRMPDDVIRDMAELKMAAALLRTGRREEAVAVYRRHADLESLALCGVKPGEQEYTVVTTEMQRHGADAESMGIALQGFLNTLTYDAAKYKSDESGMEAVAQRFMSDCNAPNRRLWTYTAAALAAYRGDYHSCAKLAGRGMAMGGNDFLAKSFRVLRMYARAKAADYGARYENQLYTDLAWLDRQIIARAGQKDVRTRLKFSNGYKWEQSTTYFNDAMRRILLDVVVPKALQAGQATRALQLANIAEYRLFLLTGVEKVTTLYYVYDGFERDYGNDVDYSSRLFRLANNLTASQVERYVRELSAPQTAFDRFLTARSFTDKNFWNDLLGTLFMRERRYAKAARCLAKVSPEFEKSLNTYYYMKYDPFSNAPCLMDKWLLERGYKLGFARRMAGLQRTLLTSKDPNTRAQAMINYAIGLRNSFTDTCWPLTRYKESCRYYSSYDYEEWAYNPYKRPYKDDSKATYKFINNAREDYKRLTEKALKTFTDKEKAAWQMVRLNRRASLMDTYPDTKAAAFVRAHCDEWNDYI